MKRKIKMTAFAMAMIVTASTTMSNAMIAKAEEMTTAIESEIATNTDIEETIEIEVNAGSLEINQSNFPDENFRKYLISTFSKDGKTISDIDQIEEINCSWKNIGSIKGIELFKNLKKLDCSHNQLKDIDISKNTNLTELDCSYNVIESLNVKSNTKLQKLKCWATSIKTIDVSKNKELLDLECYCNNIQTIDVSNNAKLVNLFVSQTRIKSLDVSKNPNLGSLSCWDCELEQLDVSNNKKLEVLNCNNTKIKSINIKNNNLIKILDVSKTSINKIDVSNLENLENLKCNLTPINQLDLKNNKQLSLLHCNDTNISSLDISNLKNLSEVQCYNAPIKDLKLLQNENLKMLKCYGTQITYLDFKQAPKIDTIDVDANTKIDISNCTPFYLTYRVDKLKGLVNLNNIIGLKKDLITDTAYNAKTGDLQYNLYNNGRLSEYVVKTSQFKRITGVNAGGLVISTNIKPVEKIEVTDKIINLKVDEKKNINYNVYPENASCKKLSWMSDNTSVAVVDSDGVVTAKKEGKANINFTAQDGTEISGTCEVNVSKKDVKVSSIAINKKELTLTEGDMETLTASILPNDATDKRIVWTSDNESVVKVENKVYPSIRIDGEVTGLKPGKATITAKAFDGSGVMATCTVTVLAKTVNVTGITLNKTATSLVEGNTETLTATVAPSNATNKAITWTTSNSSVATVDANGKITAVKAGSAVITATAKDGSGVKATCTVTVTAKTVAVTGITLNKTATSLVEGNTETLTATVAPSNATNKAITWTTSNSSVATVDANGKITAVKPGSAVITATAKDGSGVKATCTVTVTAKTIAVTGITLNKTTTSLVEGNTETLTATVAPSNATNKAITWTTSNASVATVDTNGKVTAVKAGSAVITATAKDGSGVKATCTVNVSKKQEPTTEEPTTEEPVKAPTSAGIYINSMTKDGIVAGLVVDVEDKSGLEFSWYATADNGKNWFKIQDWKRGNEWLNWVPDKFGDYIIVGKVRVINDESTALQDGTNVSFHPHIKGKCQMPYTGKGGGYLIGVETYDNPNQSYKYEMLILDCTLLAEGKDAWVYTTGQCSVAEGNALWTIWQPQYGYYWTLFRVYDKNGTLIDEECYGFANAY